MNSEHAGHAPRVPRDQADAQLLVRIDSFLDDLLQDEAVASSSLASILIAARSSIEAGYHVALARRTWNAGNELQSLMGPTLVRGSRRWRVH